MAQENSEEPKLIIDEDWKTQVQREKEELKRKQEASGGESTPEAGRDSGSAADAAASQGHSENLPPPPPASLSFLVTSLATQAMAALGQLPGDDGQALPVNLDYARHFIDLIGVIEEKTKGNLEPEESTFLGETLHQMRMLFVAVSQRSR